MGNFTDAGFQKENLDEWITKIEEIEKDVCGEDIELGETTPIGQMVQVLSQVAFDIDNVTESIYWAKDPDNSTGINLTKQLLKQVHTEMGRLQQL